MKNIFVIILILFSVVIFANDIDVIIKQLDSNLQYAIFDEKDQIIIENLRCDYDNKNYIVSKNKEDENFDLNQLGNFEKNIYEDNNCVIKYYLLLPKIESENTINQNQKLAQFVYEDKNINKQYKLLYFKFMDFSSPYPKYKVYDATILSDNSILIPVFKFNNLYIYSIKHYGDNNKNIVYRYLIPTNVYENHNITSVDFVTNNIIRINKYPNYKEYWKITQNNEDYEKNKINMINNNILTKYDIYLTKLLWMTKPKDINKEYISYDYFEQDEEPTIEQLKEKFPNDTFFTEPEAEQKSIINTTDSTSPGLWQKISLWCRNIISKFTV